MKKLKVPLCSPAFWRLSAVQQAFLWLTDCCSHLATRAAESLQVFDELWPGSVSNCGQCSAAIGQPVTYRKWRSALSHALMLSERWIGFHIPLTWCWEPVLEVCVDSDRGWTWCWCSDKGPDWLSRTPPPLHWPIRKKYRKSDRLAGEALNLC